MKDTPQDKPQDKKKQGNEVLQGLSFFTQIGVTMAACIFVGVFLGKYLDRLLGTSPWLLLVFSLLGAAAALRQIFVMAKKR